MILRLRRARFLGSLVLAWFALSLGVAIASPLVQPKQMQLVCSGAGAIMMVVQTDDDGAQQPLAGHLDCPLCALAGAPPPPVAACACPVIQPLGLAVQPIPAARIAAAAAAPLPARGPPSFS